MESTVTILWIALFVITLPETVTTESPYAGTVSVVNSCASIKLDKIRNASCSFDKDMCTYQNLNPDARWVLKNEKVGGWLGFGKTGEHTNNGGYFIQPNTGSSRALRGASFELALPEILAGAFCLDFWYDERGSSVSSLQVIVECPAGRRNIAWQGHTGSHSWKHVALLLHMETQYKVIFKMEKEDSSRVTGLDDVNVYSVATNETRSKSQHLYCEQTTAVMFLDEMTTATIPNEFYGNDSDINCTFENGSCTWHVGKDSDFNWHIGNSNGTQELSAPRSDHTTGNGRYAYIRGSEARRSTWKAVLESNTIESEVPLQFSFWFIMNGIGVGSLSVFQISSGNVRQKVWSRTGRQGPDWTQAVMELTSGSYTLVFEASTKYHYLSDLAIDDTILTNITLTTTTAAPTTTQLSPVSLPISCDFEADMCGFYPPSSDPGYVMWERTPSPLTVLSRVYVIGDNTTGSGSFLSLRANGAEAHRGDVASIVSPALEAQTGACLRLAYIMPSTLSGTITVYKRNVQTGELRLLEHLSGYYGQDWQSLQVDVQSDTTFQIEIKGSYAGEPGAVIGVDDMALENAPCPKTTPSPPPTTTTLPPPPFEVSHVCGDHDEQDISNMSCSFDSTVCSYSSIGDKLQWIQHNDSYHIIPGGKTGPYIVINTADVSTPHGSTAQLKSPIFNGPDICLTFWYINPSSSSNLEVSIEFISGAKSLIWSTDGHEHSEWQSVSLSVKTKATYRLVFQSKKSNTFGPVGLDEIYVYETSMVSVPPPSKSTKTTHTVSASTLSSTQLRTAPASSTLPPISDSVTFSSLSPIITSTSLPNSSIQSSGRTSTSNLASTKTISVFSKTVSSQMPSVVTSSVTKSETAELTVTDTVTPDNTLTTKITFNESNNEKSTENNSSTNTKALAIGLSVGVFGLCGIVLAGYLLKRNKKIENQKDPSVPMKDVKQTNAIQNGIETNKTTTGVNVICYKKLDV
ncbi:MAM and LDL-receptor class A domain-containing protein 1-like [Ylistrum balloti]|uniref:MAM and LDL-receptor class A domain-containing protein 1-like n=1 Tax=Ylistrum balloti TaxID=509963 RepID=UPI0029057DAA|nr:MAM and LDL-receptor class A domain-containing protein 1-like [Ylistrum balloti]